MNASEGGGRNETASCGGTPSSSCYHSQKVHYQVTTVPSSSPHTPYSPPFTKAYHWPGLYSLDHLFLTPVRNSGVLNRSPEQNCRASFAVGFPFILSLHCIHNKNYCQILRIIDDLRSRHVGNLGILSDNCKQACMHVCIAVCILICLHH